MKARKKNTLNEKILALFSPCYNEGIDFNCKNATVFIIVINHELAWHKSVYMLGLKKWEGAVVTFSWTSCDLTESNLDLHTFGFHQSHSFPLPPPSFCYSNLKTSFHTSSPGIQAQSWARLCGTSTGCSWREPWGHLLQPPCSPRELQAGVKVGAVAIKATISDIVSSNSF